MDDVHRPVVCLAFLLPMLLLYEVGMVYLVPHLNGETNTPGRVIAFYLLQKFTGLIGLSGYYMPGVAAVVILVAWQMARGGRWKVRGQTLLGMLLESLMLAIPLLVLSHVANSYSAVMAADAGGHTGVPKWLSDLLLSVGAGIYEELLFRLILISILSILLMDVLRISEGPAIFTIVMASAVIFSLYHYLGDETFKLHNFVFRTMAGGYLAGVFILRGFGITVGCHALYDVAAMIMNGMIYGSEH